MLKAAYKKHRLKFKTPGGTSRGVLTFKDSWYIVIRDAENPDKTGIGECGIIPKLSIDDRPDFEVRLNQVIDRFNKQEALPDDVLTAFPAIQFGMETALLDLGSQHERVLFPSNFTEGLDGIPINGLIWMGDFEEMRRQIIEKLETGFTCIKLKIGAIAFEEELALLKMIRKEFKADEIELRVDANGAFNPEEAHDKLKQLADYQIHSIEQPIQPGQWDKMASLCADSPLPVALDEELIGVTEPAEIRKMLNTIRPAYIILKPALIGGFNQSEQWINIAGELGINWWVTSALEGNIGLNAIAQWTYTLQNSLPQGLGTGQLFTNNIPSPLEIRDAKLVYDRNKSWNLNYFKND